MESVWSSASDALAASAHAAAHASASAPLEGQVGVLLALGGGVVAGLVHVFTGPDHLAAVAPLSVRHGSRAWRAGWSWGTGHAVGAAAVTLLALALRSTLPIEMFSPWSRLAVGLSLVCIGFAGIRRAFRAKGVEEDHATSHRAAYVVGMLHGAGGLAHLFAVVPALLLPSAGDAAFYLAAYCVSSIAAMTLFAGSIGIASARLARATLVSGGVWTAARVERTLLIGSSALAAVVGVIWIGL